MGGDSRTRSSQRCLDGGRKRAAAADADHPWAVADRVIEAATKDILALEPARREIGSHQPFAEREESVGENQVVVPPAAVVESFGPNVQPTRKLLRS